MYAKKLSLNVCRQEVLGHHGGIKHVLPVAQLSRQRQIYSYTGCW